MQCCIRFLSDEGWTGYAIEYVSLYGCEDEWGLHGLESYAFYRFTALQRVVDKADSYEWV